MSKLSGIHVRLSSEERSALERAAVRSGKTCSDVVRTMIMGLEVANDLKLSNEREGQATRSALSADIENLRRQLNQALLDLRVDLREDQKKSVIAAVEAVTGKKVVASGGAKS